MAKWESAPLVGEKKKQSWETAPLVEEEKTEEQKKPITDIFKGPHKIPELVKGIGKRVFEDRPERVEKPTIAGDIAEKIPIVGETLSKVVSGPERAYRTAAGIVGTAGEPMGAVAELGMKGIDKLSGGKISKFATEKISDIAETEPVQKAVESYKGLPESVRANIEAVPDIMDALGVKTGKVAKKPLMRSILKKIPEKPPKKSDIYIGELVTEKISPEDVKIGGPRGERFPGIENIEETPVLKGANVEQRGPIPKHVREGIVKGVGIKTRGPKDWGKTHDFIKSGSNAVQTITKHRKALNILDKDGNLVPMGSPIENAAEMSQAIRQTKAIIYKQYHDLAMQAGIDASLDAKPIIKKLYRILGRDKLKYTDEERVRVVKLIKDVASLHGAAPEVLEERIKKWNYSFPKIQSGGTERLTAEMDLLAATEIRKQLDDKITKATGEQYQPLRNQYKDLSAIEDKVTQEAHRRLSRAGVTLPGLTDVFTIREFVGGLIGQNPQLLAMGAAGKGMAWWMKRAFDPDRKIANMFKKTYATAEEGPKQPLFGIGEGIPATPVLKGTGRGLEDEERKMQYYRGKPALPMR